MLTLLMNRSDTVDLYVKWIVMLSTFFFEKSRSAEMRMMRERRMSLRDRASAREFASELLFHFYYGGIKPLANYSLMNKSETKKYVLLVKTENS